jgi:hypothetical protein
MKVPAQQTKAVAARKAVVEVARVGMAEALKYPRLPKNKRRQLSNKPPKNPHPSSLPVTGNK